MKNPYEHEPSLDAIDLVINELDRQRNKPTIVAIEESNSRNDRIAIALAYLGRASDKAVLNGEEDTIDNLVKAAAIICAAVNAELRSLEAEDADVPV